MEPQTPPSTPRKDDEHPPHQHVATPHAASPATAMAAKQYNEAMEAIASIALNSPKPPKTPRSCRSVWQSHGGGMAVPQSTKRLASSVLKFEPSMKKRKRGRSPPPPLDRDSKPKSE
jgi:hypothetical protein